MDVFHKGPHHYHKMKFDKRISLKLESWADSIINCLWTKAHLRLNMERVKTIVSFKSEDFV